MPRATSKRRTQSICAAGLPGVASINSRETALMISYQQEVNSPLKASAAEAQRNAALACSLNRSARRTYDRSVSMDLCLL